MLVDANPEMTEKVMNSFMEFAKLFIHEGVAPTDVISGMICAFQKLAATSSTDPEEMSQIDAVVHEVMSRTPEEIAWYREFLRTGVQPPPPPGSPFHRKEST